MLALIARGPSVLDDVKKLATSTDAEVRRRADHAAQEIEFGPGPMLPSAAIRLLAVHAPSGSVPALLRYLPFAEDELVEEEIVSALVRLTGNGPPETALLAALRDPAAPVRAVAGQVAARAGH